ncbi:MAG TPA: endonuclease III [Bacteroidota bacterium]|nr:endonuclease III [Bacteroidota bacterium]
MEWLPHLQPLFKKYGNRPHPLEHHNTYQLVVMVVLSAQTTDKLINKIAPAFFQQFPSMKELAKATPEELHPWIKSVTGFRKKADWLVRIAQAIGDDKKIPLTMEALTELPGIGRKSANVILREAGGEPQGIFVDLHVLRVVPRIGITNEEKPEKVENVLLEIIPKKYWHKAGMAFSYLGREICRPTDPNCAECLLNDVCQFANAARTPSTKKK